MAIRRLAHAFGFIRISEFDDLPGTGAPLETEDDALVPEEPRVAYRMLRSVTS
ncbi:MAG: DUF1992 domain-containing protein [Betaproteobacteria bacterium]|nr:DUF1992 domain-containing protein [Betaproteobacteria bacterium]